MGAHLVDSTVYGHLWATPELHELFDDRGRFQSWLDILVALAEAQAEVGLVPADAAGAIRAHADVERLDLARVAAETRATGHSTLGLIHCLQEVLPEDAAEWVYFGATVQDISDSWNASSCARRGRARPDLRRARARPWRWASVTATHPLRPHPRAAGPAGDVRVQGGGVGLRAAPPPEASGRGPPPVGGRPAGWGARHHGVLGRSPPSAARRFAGRSGLAAPDIAWITARDRIAEFHGLLAMVTATLAKVGNEIYELQRPEIGEVSEPFTPGQVGSITMPHKRNPELSEHLGTLARVVRADAGVAVEAMVHEHERDGRAWKAEWVVFPEACLLTGVSLAVAARLLEGLEVDAERMAANLEARGGYVLRAGAARPRGSHGQAHRARPGVRGDDGAGSNGADLAEALLADRAAGRGRGGRGAATRRRSSAPPRRSSTGCSRAAGEPDPARERCWPCPVSGSAPPDAVAARPAALRRRGRGGLAQAGRPDRVGARRQQGARPRVPGRRRARPGCDSWSPAAARSRTGRCWRRSRPARAAWTPCSSATATPSPGRQHVARRPGRGGDPLHRRPGPRFGRHGAIERRRRAARGRPAAVPLPRGGATPWARSATSRPASSWPGSSGDLDCARAALAGDRVVRHAGRARAGARWLRPAPVVGVTVSRPGEECAAASRALAARLQDCSARPGRPEPPVGARRVPRARLRVPLGRGRAPRRGWSPAPRACSSTRSSRPRRWPGCSPRPAAAGAGPVVFLVTGGRRRCSPRRRSPPDPSHEDEPDVPSGQGSCWSPRRVVTVVGHLVIHDTLETEATDARRRPRHPDPDLDGRQLPRPAVVGRRTGAGRGPATRATGLLQPGVVPGRHGRDGRRPGARRDSTSSPTARPRRQHADQARLLLLPPTGLRPEGRLPRVPDLQPAPLGHGLPRRSAVAARSWWSRPGR